MTPRRPSLLVVDDEPAIQMLLQAFADKEGFDVVAAGDGSQTLECLRPGLADVAIVDLRMPQVDGLEVLAAIRATDPGCQVILMTGDPSVETAVQAVKAGALDYLSKPFDSARLRALLAGVREELDRRQAVLASETALARRLEFCGMIARSAMMQELFGTIRRVAAHARTVLVSGETGSGKELVAAALHRLGPRAAHPPIAVNCSAIVEPLFESEVFGHVRGAFTGAATDKPGLFEAAHGGTLLLDEVGELALSMQAKLLRTLETGEVLRVGGTRAAGVDVRVIAMTNRTLADEVTAGRFRSDLFYRLDVMHLIVPPLRERMEDVPYLTAAFVQEFAARFGKDIRGLTPAAEQALSSSTWPGNVRELRNTIERACLVADGAQLTDRDVRAVSAREDGPTNGTLAALERDRIAQVLDECAGNKAQAARRLGLDRRSLYRRLERYGLEATPPALKH
jgi:DNA-binding NtrC family response regulator